MREVEIKFRGKPIEDYGDTKWFYGNAVINYEDKLAYIEAVGQGFVLVEWETVGQFTGFTDLYSNESYEGDIVEYGGWFYIIKWDEEETGFYMHDKNNYEDDHLRMIDISVGEIMDNIYDNQNLIK
ncbi:YopX family protein [Bacillus cereus]|uniref:YopX protein domain-containing protein n=1 Tax=Bacillus cereus TaxID=1396 RepID=A0A2B1K1R1_BACCE|nr:YopX family protein [Bacillus cereus]PFN18016.1 hypothetical protein COJ50_26350 [Bacillus cereus]